MMQLQAIFGREWRWLAPRSTEPWTVLRVLFALHQLLWWSARLTHVPELYSSAGIPFATGRVPLPEWIVFSPATAYIIWASLIAGLILVLFGRQTRIGLLLYIVCAWTLNFTEGLNYKAYDRLAFWQAIALLICPGENKREHSLSTAARFFLLLVYCGLYGSTGFAKALLVPEWWVGAPLAYHFVHVHFGGGPLAVHLSGQAWLLSILGKFTLIFECGFPFLIWFKKINPWVLLLGVFLHLGILTTMNVGLFSFVALSGYVVLLHPEVFERWKKKIQHRMSPLPAGGD